MTTAAAAAQLPFDARCGTCGYSTQGLTTPTCPECGSDLRTVGIFTTHQRRRLRLGLVGGAVTFTLVVAAVAYVLNPIVTELLPLKRTYEKSIIVTMPSGRRYDVVGRATTWREERPPLKVTVTPASGVELPKGADEDAGLAALARRASRVTEPLLERVQMTRMTNRGQGGWRGMSTTESESASAAPPPGSWYFVRAPWVLAWLAGLRFLWRNRSNTRA